MAVASRFRGFDNLEALQVGQGSFRCEKCANACEVNRVEADGEELFFGDRCERFSGKARPAATLTDHFAERTRILNEYLPAAGGEPIGLARVGVLEDYLPFWGTVLGDLGYSIVLSRRSDRQLVAAGVRAAPADFCFPFKVSFGHYLDLAGRVPQVLVPDVAEGVPTLCRAGSAVRAAAWKRSCTCPYLQNFHTLVTATLKAVRILNPHISFREGDPVAALAAVLPRPQRRLRRAVERGLEAQTAFKEGLRRLGEQVIDRGVVLVGRPYAALDEGLNLGVARKIRARGVDVYPLDFLPLPGEDLSGRWPNEFSAQGQAILNAAHVMRERELDAVFLDYYGCGPNSFIRGFFAQEFGRPFLTLQLDEHSADAGVETRIEAFLDATGR